MPIVSRTIDTQPSVAGTIFASWAATDTKGRVWRRSRARFADLAVAQAASDAFDWGPQLQDKEEEDAVEFIRAGGDPTAFVKSDLTSTQFNRRIALRFWRTRFEQDRDFLCNVADWVAGFTAVQIKNALGITLAKAQTVLDRATHIRDTICDALSIDDGRVEDV